MADTREEAIASVREVLRSHTRETYFNDPDGNEFPERVFDLDGAALEVGGLLHECLQLLAAREAEIERLLTENARLRSELREALNKLSPDRSG